MKGRYIRKTIAACLAVCFMLTAVGCAGTDDDSTSSVSAQSGEDKQGNTSAKDIITQVKEVYPDNLDSEAYFGDNTFTDNCQKLYGIDSSELTDGAIVYAGSGGLADEISILRPSDGDTDKAVSALEARREMRINDFTGYKPDEVTKVEGCQIFSQDGYAVLVISDKADDIAKEIKGII